MNRLNHSPGPWKIFPLPEASRIQIESPKGHVVCEVHTFSRQRAPKANAQLISAAPDLYEALLSLSKIMDEGHIGKALHQKMIKALKKATSPLALL